MRIALYRGVAALGAAAGCSGGGGGSAPQSAPTRAELFDASEKAFDAAADRLESRFNTSFAGMSTTGSAVFKGKTYIAVNTAPSMSELAGDARVKVNFASGDVTGKFDKFLGRDALGQLDSYKGEVQVTGGTIGAAVPNDISLDYSGRLRGNGDTLRPAGELTGKFKGTPIRGFIASDIDRLADLNGSPTLTRVFVVGETD